MIVTLDAFSGRPNPSWRLSEKDSRQFIERIATRAVASADESETDGVLGPRGFIVTASSDDELPENIPASVRVAGPTSAAASYTSGASALSATESAEIGRFLLNTGRHVLEEDLLSFLESSAQTQAQPAAQAEVLWPEPAEPAEEAEETPSGSQPAGAEEAPGVMAACVIANTPYSPGFWNTPAVQPKNNCYNYAMNHRSDTFAQPGRISGHLYTAINCPAMSTAANWDGCKTTCSGPNKNVALVISLTPGFIDFHWYRKQSQGFWAHKPGGGTVRNVDNRSRLIDGVRLTPANCDRGPYKFFCGYRFSPKGLKVR